MPRPQQKTIQLTIDGREVQAVEGTMLVDAAKFGDVEIPYFCYHHKLGKPVGACRMCLVEIEGIPKLQTSCSTAVKDGMVVHTQTDRVKQAQNGVVEFLLVNHPLDCPVCDKGGECPLQDISFGWGLGRSRFIEPKRHFVKPISLSPVIAIDRERCILCYRCVRFSQEVAEDYQLIFAERGADTFVSTHDGHPYVAPFSGNITELCPVGALTSKTYRFRARPWDIEGAAGICMLCPSQCNVEFTVRDEKVLRVLSRDPENAEVDDGWLCDKGRYAFQAIHVDERITAPLVRDGGELREVSWERALDEAAGLGKHRGRVGALVGGQATNEEGFLFQRLMREGLASADLDCRRTALPGDLAKAVANPALQAKVSDLEFADTVLVLGCELLDDAPILDLRIRKGVRRRGVRLVVATDRPSALDSNAQTVIRYTPGDELGCFDRLRQLLRGAPPAQPVVGQDIVIVWGERLGPETVSALLELAGELGLAQHEGAGLLEIPSGANGRGLREAGVLPDCGPGYAPVAYPGRSAADMAGDDQLTAYYLFETDPLRDQPDRAAWERALHRAGLVVAHASVLTEGLREHANVVFPADTYAEKEGTVVHPDGRVQRLRTAIAHPGEVRPGWWVIAELAKRIGLDTGVLTASMAFHQLVQAVPFYEGLTLEEIGGRGLRWPEREAASAFPEAPEADGVGEKAQTDGQIAQATANGALRLGIYRPIWAAPEVEISPSLEYTVAHQQAELSPEDAERLGIASGDRLTVSQLDDSGAAQPDSRMARAPTDPARPDAERPAGASGGRAGGRPEGTRLAATAAVRSGVPPGTVFLATGIAEDSANALTEPTVEVKKA